MAELKAGDIAICIDASDLPALDHGAAYEVLAITRAGCIAQVRRVARMGEPANPELAAGVSRFRCHG